MAVTILKVLFIVDLSYLTHYFASVIPIWREPLPGWTDNINGPTGLLIGELKRNMTLKHYLKLSPT